MALTLAATPIDVVLLTEAGLPLEDEQGEFIYADIGNNSVIGAKGQVFYEFRRRDHEVVWSNNATVLKATITGDQTSKFTNGDSIFIGADTNYNEVGTVASVPAFSSGETTFDTSVTFIAIDGGGYINNLSTHTNYRVVIQVWNDGVTTQQIVEDFEYVPKQSGILQSDFADLMLFILRDNKVLSRFIAIKYKEIWNQDTTGAFVTATSIQVVHGVKETSRFGTFLSVDRAYQEYLGESTSKFWLTLFPSEDGNANKGQRLLYKTWANFIYFVVDTDFNTRTTGNPEIEEYTENTAGGTALLTGPTAVSTTVTVFEHEIVNNNNSAYAIQLQVKENNTNAEMFESYTLLNTNELDNPIMLQWLNSLGGKDQFMFTYNQEVKENLTKGIESFTHHAEQYPSQPTRTTNRIDTMLMQSIVVEAPQLTLSQFTAIKDIFLSDSVDIWLKKDASKKKGVIIPPEKMSYETKDKLFDMTLTIEFELGYDFFKNKEY